MTKPARWPALTILGITCAVIVGIVHAAFQRADDCLFGTDDLAPVDPLGGDGY